MNLSFNPISDLLTTKTKSQTTFIGFKIAAARATNGRLEFDGEWYDCVTDLSWLDGNGWVLILANGKSLAQGHEEVFHTAIEILSSAAEHWRQQKKPFWVFVQAQADWDFGLPRIVGE